MVVTTDLRGKTLLASAFHAPEFGAVEFLQNALFAIDLEGQILSVKRPDEADYSHELTNAEADGRLVREPPLAYLLPGFVDLHVHAPQYPQLGVGLDEPLEVWLEKYTFPLEARYRDVAFARRVYQRLVRDLLAHGTTTVLYFATLHQEATRALADICLEQGQRALIGRVAMDNPDLCPAFYRDASPEAAVEETRAFIDYVRNNPENGAGRVEAVVTPRFIPACTDAALEGLGRLAQDCGCAVQTHVSESDWEHAYVLSRHGLTDAASLDRFGLLNRRSVLAHAVHLTQDDMDRVATRKAAVAHCPASNAYFADAVFPLREALRRGLHVGLGTDISGGPSASLFDACRTAILSSRLLESGVDPALAVGARGRRASRVDFRQAFHLATAGGGKALDLPIGLFAPGYKFDAIRIDCSAEEGGVRLQDGDDTGEAILQKIIYGAARANIGAVWVDGRVVASRE